MVMMMMRAGFRGVVDGIAGGWLGYESAIGECMMANKKMM